MSILNVNTLQPVGSGQTITVTAANIAASSSTITANSFVGSVSNTSGTTVVAAGTTTAPSISPTGDSNTGIFFPAADTIAFAEGGVEAARIDSNGNLGINTTSVSAKLQVHNNITTAYANISPTLSNVTNAWVNSSPHVSGGTFVGAQYNLPGDGQNRIAYIGAISESASNRKSSLVFGTDEGGNRTEKVRITGDGNLGIGIINPSTKLEIVGSYSSGAITTSFKISGSGWSLGGGPSLEFGHDPASYPTWVTGRIASTYSGSNWGGGLKFFYNNGTTAATLTEGMELTRTGNVQIANGNLVFSTAGTGIDFSATANSSGTVSSEVLSDYEEGTWTPTYYTAGGGSVSYQSQVAVYTKIGRVVHISGRIAVTTISSPSGQVFLRGLPFTPATYSQRINGITIHRAAAWNTAPIAGTVFETNSGEIELYKASSTANNTMDLAGTDLSANCFVSFFGQYEI